MPDGIQFITLFSESQPLMLECGRTLTGVQVAYETYGRPDAEGSNAILVCHALTGDAHAAGPLAIPEPLLESVPFYRAMKPGQPGWWDGAIGPGRALDTDRYFVICSNILGSCYGTTGPLSINPETGKRYGRDFPQITVRDMVTVQHALLESLGIHELTSITGGSLGGMQALEWALMYPEMVRSIIPIATSAQHSPWAIAMNHVGRSAILNDPEYQKGNDDSALVKGLGIARQIGMISYRSAESFLTRFHRDRLKNNADALSPDNLFQVENYLNYQGQKLMNRFDPNSYLLITRALDDHDIARNRGTLAQVFKSIRSKALCIGVNSDILYPAWEQRRIAAGIPDSLYREIDSPDGHDAFLIAFDQLERIIKPFLNSL